MKIDSLKKKIIPLLKKNDIVKAGIFGSFARGEQRKGSDVDILIKYRKSKSLLDLVRLERELEMILGKKVDLLTYNSINPLIRDKILSEEVQII